jgi:hypothetical protein
MNAILNQIKQGDFTTKAVPLTDLLAWVEENSVQYHKYGIIDTDDLKAAVTKMAEGM